jgi:hypothetical protein
MPEGPSAAAPGSAPAHSRDGEPHREPRKGRKGAAVGKCQEAAQPQVGPADNPPASVRHLCKLFAPWGEPKRQKAPPAQRLALTTQWPWEHAGNRNAHGAASRRAGGRLQPWASGVYGSQWWRFGHEPIEGGLAIFPLLRADTPDFIDGTGLSKSIAEGSAPRAACGALS